MKVSFVPVHQVGTYRFGLLLLQGEQALPPAQHTTLGLHQVAADLMETLLLLRGPVQERTAKERGRER